MAKHRKQATAKRRNRVLGTLLMVLALLVLVSLISHRPVDDAGLRGGIDLSGNPWEVQYRNQAGLVGAFLSWCLLFFLGWLAYFLPLGLFLMSGRMFAPRLVSGIQLKSALAFALALIGTMIYDIPTLAERTVSSSLEVSGGYVTKHLTGLTLHLFGFTGSYVILAGLGLVLIAAFTSITPRIGSRWLTGRFGFLGRLGAAFGSAGRWIASIGKNLRWPGKKNDTTGYEDSYEETEISEVERDPADAGRVSRPANRAGLSEEKPARRRSVIKKKAEPIRVESMDYTYPGLELLDDNPYETPAVTSEELQFTARMLKETLETFDVRIEGPIESRPGPVITRYEFKPAAGIKVNRIVGLSDDLALSLKAKRIRIIAPIPGKAAVGVEIPNRKPQTVFLKEILQSQEFADSKLTLPLALGRTTAGKPFVADLANMPHLLIAGATGSGKSVCMNALITSLIYRLHPVRVRFIFIDPKMLELSVYSGIPQLGRPVVTKPKRAEKVFADTVAEMENRYRKLASSGVRSIEDFNLRQTEEETKLPYILIFVDELADLMMSTTSSRTELLITRLAQMARAVGIHLVLATQRPSVDVITGLIKANFPARIAFQVSSKVDSRTIIDGNGAEKLLGNGDMLFLNSGQPEPQRIHGAFVSSAETERLVEFIRNQGLSMLTLEGITQGTGDTKEKEVDLGDPLFREACEVVIRHKQGSVSLLQRRLGIGYQRAARLIDRLEQAGIVSPFDGSKARDVLVDQAYLETIFAGKTQQTSPE